jgi:hypothetical protein
MWPSGAGRRGSGEIPASRRRGSAGRGREAACGLLGAGSWSRLGLGVGRRRGSTARPGGGRLELGSGELSAGATMRAVVRAPVGSRGGSRDDSVASARREDHPAGEWHGRRSADREDVGRRCQSARQGGNALL